MTTSAAWISLWRVEKSSDFSNSRNFPNRRERFWPPNRREPFDGFSWYFFRFFFVLLPGKFQCTFTWEIIQNGFWLIFPAVIKELRDSHVTFIHFANFSRSVFSFLEFFFALATREENREMLVKKPWNGFFWRERDKARELWKKWYWICCTGHIYWAQKW